MAVRKYNSEDYQAVCAIDKNLFEGMGGYVLFRHIEELFPSLFFVAVNESGKIAGYVLGGINSDDTKTAKLIRIGVVEEFQRKGFGEKLTSALLCEMKKRGVKKVHLTVSENNIHAISFYLKNGFAEKARVENYFYPDTSRLIFEKEI